MFGIWRNRAGIVALVFLVSASASSTTRASWADRLFTEQKHDFGPVPRGARLRHVFRINNTLAEPITILDVHASCGCTTGRASQAPIAPGQSATVDAEMDTKNFVGKKATTLYVTLVNASGREAEVRLGVSTVILSDIVLNPGTIDFGSVAKGQGAEQTLTIDRIGMPDWKVNRMISTSRVLDASLVETARDGATVAYLLKVSLKPGTPAGTVRDEIQLLTNDPETPAFPIQVTGAVRGDVSASPSVLALGDVASSGQAEGRFLVRASRPFVVRSIEGVGEGFRATIDDATAKRIHFVSVTYRPLEGKTRGDLRHPFRIVTDLAGEPPVDLMATLRVEP